MSKTVSINVEHITRVEGHGNIVVRVRDDKLETCHFEVVEAPRFFEAMLKGRSWYEAAIITSRICGICSIGHQMTSLKATETALKIPVSEQTVLFRKLLVDGSILSSHLLHVLFLAAPDVLGVPSAFALMDSNPHAVELALKTKRLANDLCDAVGGRMIHPITCVPGGFTDLPTPEVLRDLKTRYEKEMLPMLFEVADILESVAENFPDFTRETEFISLGDASEYPFYDGRIASTDGETYPVDEYLSVTNETIVDHSTAKHTHNKRASYMVGALARLNNNFDKLTDTAKQVAARFGLAAVNHNPFMNNVAQLVECVHCAQTVIGRIDDLLQRGIEPEKPPREWKGKPGRGVGSTEVPRGILFHDYTYDATGRIVKANCVIPTNQNFANVDLDMQAFVPEMLQRGMDDNAMQFNLEMLVRAYDPCISCSVHMVKVD
ncbi:MAG: Ni/Fe hydrogenase subunit alpha [Deltaproteobacteria bacterium]|nr:Ni/Fe hydrogenase subunit alpha [Deltaproteobacteria bacterium]